MATIQENLETIKNAVYGHEVRQALHDAIEYSYNTADNASNTAQESADTANDALNVANGIASTAQSASSTATQAENKATQAYNIAMGFSDDIQTLKESSDPQRINALTSDAIEEYNVSWESGSINSSGDDEESENEFERTEHMDLHKGSYLIASGNIDVVIYNRDTKEYIETIYLADGERYTLDNHYWVRAVAGQSSTVFVYQRCYDVVQIVEHSVRDIVFYPEYKRLHISKNGENFADIDIEDTELKEKVDSHDSSINQLTDIFQNKSGLLEYEPKWTVIAGVYPLRYTDEGDFILMPSGSYVTFNAGFTGQWQEVDTSSGTTEVISENPVFDITEPLTVTFDKETLIAISEQSTSGIPDNPWVGLTVYRMIEYVTPDDLDKINNGLVYLVPLYNSTTGASSGTLSDAYDNYKYLLIDYEIACENSSTLTGTLTMSCAKSTVDSTHIIRGGSGAFTVGFYVGFTGNGFKVEPIEAQLGYAWYICDVDSYDYDVTVTVTKVVGVK